MGNRSTRLSVHLTRLSVHLTIDRPNAFWYVNEQVRLDNVVILDIDTKSNPADLFTK
eukprot:SAG11_NODE_38956_length_245_cov_0.780822_1_plen_56_part_01